jgi:hypothetical protein
MLRNQKQCLPDGRSRWRGTVKAVKATEEEEEDDDDDEKEEEVTDLTMLQRRLNTFI